MSTLYSWNLGLKQPTKLKWKNPVIIYALCIIDFAVAALSAVTCIPMRRETSNTLLLTSSCCFGSKSNQVMDFMDWKIKNEDKQV